MEVTVTERSALPEGSILSVRCGPTRRQAPLKVLEAQPLKFPSVVEAWEEPLKIDVLQPIASVSLALRADETDYHIGLNTDSQDAMAIGLCIRPMAPAETSSAPPGNISTLPGNSMPGEKAVPILGKYQDAAFSARGYLETHGLLHYVQTLLHAIIQDRPTNPYLFMADQLRAATMVSNTEALTSARQAQPAAQQLSAKDLDVQAAQSSGPAVQPPVPKAQLAKSGVQSQGMQSPLMVVAEEIVAPPLAEVAQPEAGLSPVAPPAPKRSAQCRRWSAPHPRTLHIRTPMGSAAQGPPDAAPPVTSSGGVSTVDTPRVELPARTGPGVPSPSVKTAFAMEAVEEPVAGASKVPHSACCAVGAEARGETSMDRVAPGECSFVPLVEALASTVHEASKMPEPLEEVAPIEVLPPLLLVADEKTVLDKGVTSPAKAAATGPAPEPLPAQSEVPVEPEAASRTEEESSELLQVLRGALKDPPHHALESGQLPLAEERMQTANGSRMEPLQEEGMESEPDLNQLREHVKGALAEAEAKGKLFPAIMAAIHVEERKEQAKTQKKPGKCSVSRKFKKRESATEELRKSLKNVLVSATKSGLLHEVLRGVMECVEPGAAKDLPSATKAIPGEITEAAPLSVGPPDPQVAPAITESFPATTEATPAEAMPMLGELPKPEAPTAAEGRPALVRAASAEAARPSAEQLKPEAAACAAIHGPASPPTAQELPLATKPVLTETVPLPVEPLNPKVAQSLAEDLPADMKAAPADAVLLQTELPKHELANTTAKDPPSAAEVAPAEAAPQQAEPPKPEVTPAAAKELLSPAKARPAETVLPTVEPPQPKVAPATAEELLSAAKAMPDEAMLLPAELSKPKTTAAAAEELPAATKMALVEAEPTPPEAPKPKVFPAVPARGVLTAKRSAMMQADWMLPAEAPQSQAMARAAAPCNTPASEPSSEEDVAEAEERENLHHVAEAVIAATEAAAAAAVGAAIAETELEIQAPVKAVLTLSPAESKQVVNDLRSLQESVGSMQRESSCLKSDIHMLAVQMQELKTSNSTLRSSWERAEASKGRILHPVC